jgi:hypothetical protein
MIFDVHGAERGSAEPLKSEAAISLAPFCFLADPQRLEHMRLGGMSITDAMKRLIEIFAAHSPEPATLLELQRMLEDRETWKGAHELFDRIRRKGNASSGKVDVKVRAQYCFEKACAKTLYNFTREPAPFDLDSPYWIIPNAIVTAELYGIDVQVILRAVVEED